MHEEVSTECPLLLLFFSWCDYVFPSRQPMVPTRSPWQWSEAGGSRNQYGAELGRLRDQP